MAGHLKICELDMTAEYPIRQMVMCANRTIHNSVGKVLGWLNKIETTNTRFLYSKEWSEFFIGRRKIRVLPHEYIGDKEENNVSLDFGELPVGKKVTSYGKAIFEVHYDRVRKYAKVYMVA